jgi:SSS family solute:Na+ symporter
LIAALALYGAVVLLVGVFTARRGSRSNDAFLVGDRSFGTLATWAALSSTTIGGSTTLVLAALVASKGLPALWLDLAGALGLLLLGLFLARRVRETAALTIAEVIGRAYGTEVRKVAAFLVVLAEIVWFALLTEATETVVTAATSWPADLVLVATAALFVAYTALGGQRAVVGTDLFQFGLMVASLVLVAVPLAIRSLASTGVPEGLLRFPTSPLFSATDVLAMLVLVGLPHAVGSDVWAKLLSARDANVARRAALGAAASKLTFGVATATIALAGVAAHVGVQAGGRPAELFPRTVLFLAGSALAPLFFVALIATMQSSADSVLLSASAATAHDLLGDRLGAWATRLLVVAFGAFGLFVAILHRDLVETFRLGYRLFASSLILPTLVAFVPRIRVAPRIAAAAMLLGGATATALHFRPVVGIDPVLFGTGVNALVLAFGARRVSAADPERPPARSTSEAGA